MLRIVHFADVHIDIASQRKRDPETGLPIRVLDFLKALDVIVDTAVQEKVDLVLFAGDAYKDRTPVPTYQREWGRRIMRLSQAGIPTLLLVGNHDLAPASGRANALQEFDTLEVPHVKVLARPAFLSPAELFNLPLQLIALPWISRSGMVAALTSNGEETANVYEELEKRITGLVNHWLETANPEIPVLLTAHGMVQGAELGSERTISLGSDLTFPGALVKDPRLAYTALGHIHKYQDLNNGSQPPVIYPGSIERVDFGEIKDDKGFVIVSIEQGKPTLVERRVIPGRRFIDKFVQLDNPGEVASKLQAVMPSPEELEGAIFRLTMDYPRSLEPLIDEPAIRLAAETALEFHLARKVQIEARSRVAGGTGISGLNSEEQLESYWRAAKVDPLEMEALNRLAKSIVSVFSGVSETQE
jgi:DNA repair protein SbcD/Mre11